MSKWELNNHIKSLIDYIFPRFCISCLRKLSLSEIVVCKNCLESIKNISAEELKLEYNKKFSKDNFVDDLKSLYWFEKDKILQHILHAYKYDNKIYIGKFLGELIYSNLYDEIKKWNINLIIPVPLHSLKKAQRGFNQSYFIAKSLSKKINIPINTKIIKRKKYTETQTKMNLLERKENVRNAFIVKSKSKVIDKKIILIDDVITTGATINECAKVLKENGAKKVYAISVAIPIDYILSGAETPKIDNPFLNTI
ncbi:MAG: ComF family protein [Melioribacteraceae bacterium]|nr:ComF family protein [Melioribacteraceae bacterium]